MHCETISVTITALEKTRSEAIIIQAKDVYKTPDLLWLYISAHNVYYVKYHPKVSLRYLPFITF